MTDMEGRVNFSIHLPDPLLAERGAYVQTQQTTRSGVIREAVREYLARHALQVWPADLERWMREPIRHAVPAHTDSLRHRRGVVHMIIEAQNQLLTKADLEIALSPVRTDLAVLKWMMGVLVAGVLSLILKTFF